LKPTRLQTKAKGRRAPAREGAMRPSKRSAGKSEYKITIRDQGGICNAEKLNGIACAKIGKHITGSAKGYIEGGNTGAGDIKLINTIFKTGNSIMNKTVFEEKNIRTLTTPHFSKKLLRS
jgi:hypothetical protein